MINLADLLKVSHNVGHSEKGTPGKQSPDGVKEWTQAAEVCKLVIFELACYEGVAQKRFDDPSGRVDYSLHSRYTAVNDWGAHVHIDYHLNAYGSGWNGSGGVEVWVDRGKPEEAYELAKKVQANLVAATGFRDRGVKEEAWDMVHFTKMTAILIELGFMTNKEEAMFIRSVEGRKKIAKAIVAALVSQYGLKRKYPEVEEVVNGWQRYSGVYYYYKDGKRVKGWLEYRPNEWYYLEPSQGAMVTGLQTIGSKQYFFFDSGKMALTDTNGAIINA
jgi:N-acetylmuramoyl-L-alanine amidase